MMRRRMRKKENLVRRMRRKKENLVRRMRRTKENLTGSTWSGWSIDVLLLAIGARPAILIVSVIEICFLRYGTFFWVTIGIVAY